MYTLVSGSIRYEVVFVANIAASSRSFRSMVVMESQLPAGQLVYPLEEVEALEKGLAVAAQLGGGLAAVEMYAAVAMYALC